MDNFTVAVIAVVVLVVLYLLFYKHQEDNTLINLAVQKAAASCAAMKDSVTYAVFLVDYAAAEALIQAALVKTPVPSIELSAIISTFNNVSCNKYATMLNSLRATNAAIEKLASDTATDNDYKNAGNTLVLYWLAEEEMNNSITTSNTINGSTSASVSTSTFPPYIWEELNDARNKVEKNADKIKQMVKLFTFAGASLYQWINGIVTKAVTPAEKEYAAKLLDNAKQMSKKWRRYTGGNADLDKVDAL